MNNLTPAERYLEHFNRILGVEPELYKTESQINGLPGVTTFVYKDCPKPGMVTGITYGLSLVNHPEWGNERKELVICVKSENTNWAKVAGFIANQSRENSTFPDGQTINFGKPIIEGSDIDSFFIYTPGIFTREEYKNIDIGYNYKISVAGLYPMYSSEIEIVKKHGVEKLRQHPDFESFSLNRKRISDI